MILQDIEFKDKTIQDIVDALNTPFSSQRLSDKKYTLFLDAQLQALHTLAHIEGNNEDMNALSNKKTIKDIAPFGNRRKGITNFFKRADTKKKSGCDTGDCGGETNVNPTYQKGVDKKKGKEQVIEALPEHIEIKETPIDVPLEQDRQAPIIAETKEIDLAKKVDALDSVLDCETSEEVQIYFGKGSGQSSKETKARMLTHIEALNPAIAADLESRRADYIAKKILKGIDTI